VLGTVARDAIRARLGGAPAARAGAHDATLFEPGAAFVSLHRDGSLRGCIGTLAWERPLLDVVGEMAEAAAFDDPRFPALGDDELADLEIEISVLSRPVQMSAEEIVAGWHGVSITRDDRRAVFLPQVARAEGWSRRVLLEQTCLKAGLDADAWREPGTTICTFTADLVRA
jgi:AmmeMemoRadiSam system protein A